MKLLPDPADRSQPWCGDEPAYLAHHRAVMKRMHAASEAEAPALIAAYSHAVPNLEALRVLGGLAPLLEIGAGSGYWARLLKDLGTDILAYDPAVPESNDWTAGLRLDCRRGPTSSKAMLWSSRGIRAGCCSRAGRHARTAIWTR